MEIPCLIIDDEVLSRNRIRKLLREVSDVDILDECSSGTEAIKKISEMKPKLIFLDIQMKDMTGFDVLNALEDKNKPLVVFITAFDKYALKGFEYFAFDYLLKPFSDERFYQSVERAKAFLKKNDFLELETNIKGLLNYIKTTEESSKSSTTQKLPIKLGNKVLFIDTSLIKYISASGYYAEIHTTKREYLMRESLTNLILKLDTSDFMRIHRSTIINTNYVKELVHSDYNEVDVKMLDGALFRVSKSYKKELYKKFGL